MPLISRNVTTHVWNFVFNSMFWRNNFWICVLVWVIPQNTIPEYGQRRQCTAGRGHCHPSPVVLLWQRGVLQAMARWLMQWSCWDGNAENIWWSWSYALMMIFIDIYVYDYMCILYMFSIYMHMQIYYVFIWFSVVSSPFLSLCNMDLWLKFVWRNQELHRLLHHFLHLAPKAVEWYRLMIIDWWL